jgi:hypothetical protein
MAAGKSLQDQVDEVKELVSNAAELLRQANWAMETLAGRLAETRPAPDPGPVVPVHAPAALPEARPAVTAAEPVALTRVAPVEDALPAEEPRERRRRHLRWVHGTQA